MHEYPHTCAHTLVHMNAHTNGKRKKKKASNSSQGQISNAGLFLFLSHYPLSLLEGIFMTPFLILTYFLKMKHRKSTEAACSEAILFILSCFKHSLTCGCLCRLADSRTIGTFTHKSCCLSVEKCAFYDHGSPGSRGTPGFHLKARRMWPGPSCISCCFLRGCHKAAGRSQEPLCAKTLWVICVCLAF